MSSTDGATGSNTSKTEEYIKLRVVGQDNSQYSEVDLISFDS